MATVDPVLIEITTAANMAGVEQAKAGFLGLNAATLGLAVGLGVLYKVGSDAIKNTEAMEKAHRSLSQAVDVSTMIARKLGDRYLDLQKEFDAWSQTNKRYISNQYEAETALAAFVRAGANAKDSMRELNDALDLSTLRGISMEEAQKNITLALTGSSKALKVLGITTEEYGAIMKDKHLTTEQKHLELLALIEAKTKDGRKAQTDLAQSTNALNHDWEDMTTKVGPPLLGLFGFIVGKVDDLVNGLIAIGNNKDWNRWLSSGLGAIQNAIIDVVKGIQWIEAHTGGGGGGATNARALSRPGNYAGGGRVATAEGFSGMVNSPTTFLAGEAGPEYVSVTPRGGRGSGPTAIHIHIDQGAYIDGPSVDRLANLIALRLGYATGR